jgi:hypothetical protein
MNAAVAPASSTPPSVSSRVLGRSTGADGRFARTAASATAPTGRFTKKIQRQLA